MGITSLLIAEADAARVAEGKPRAVKAVWADIPMADAYRDVTFQGGSLDSGFIPLWLGLVTALSALPPSSTCAKTRRKPRPIYVEHLLGNAEFAAQHIARRGARRRSRLRRALLPAALAGRARRRNHGAGRDPGRLVGPLPARRAAAVGIAEELPRPGAVHVAPLPRHPGPATGRPEPQGRMVQPLAAGRPRTACRRRRRSTCTRSTARTGNTSSSFPLPKTELPAPVPERRILRAPAPLSLHDGSLRARRRRPKPATPRRCCRASSPCSRETAQWTAGAASNPLCDTNNNTYEASSLTYTTAPLAAPARRSAG